LSSNRYSRGGDELDRIGESVVMLYHGGGLFTRYWGIRENRLPKNGRVSIGQTVGYVHLSANGKDLP
jgi:murein DD-endopeptidase MepM/ murein hydrolase activator NlpD